MSTPCLPFLHRNFPFILDLLYHSGMDANTTQMLQLVAKDPRNVAGRLAESLGLTRQAASARLLKAIKAGLISREGHGAGVRYSLQTIQEVQHSYNRVGLSEDRVWQELVVPVLADISERARDVWRYGLTEMINNAVDHSGSDA